LNWYRSAISAYHDVIEGVIVGKHRRVSALMTGVFNENPLTRKYYFIWDVEIVSKYIKSLPRSDAFK